MAERRKQVVRPWLWALAGFVGVLLLLFVLVVGPWLFTRHPQKGLTAEQALKARNDVRTTLVQALGGLAVAASLVVTFRTFRQNKAEQDRTYALRQGEQVNELFTKAVEQLGHGQAPVRLGALYSLVHLAQTNPEQRQTVVDVLCAYLRMPPPARHDSPMMADSGQELEVRSTAQRLIADHLRIPAGVSGQDAQNLQSSAEEPFWPGINIDLTASALFGFDFANVSVARATFDGASFTGDADFSRATFTGNALFNGATFEDGAGFSGVTFAGNSALFNTITFAGEADFRGATFTGLTGFAEANFAARGYFGDATFSNGVFFGGAVFNGEADFRRAVFGDLTVFNEATFMDIAFFSAATFGDLFDLTMALVVRREDSDVNSAARSVWPPGWVVLADPNEPTRGILVPNEQGGAVRPSASTSDSPAE